MGGETLLTYDVATTTKEGERRLRRVAKACEGYGNRVQKSVFELEISEAQLITLLGVLSSIATAEDSIRVYRLERGTFARMEQIGCLRAGRSRGATIV